MGVSLVLMSSSGGACAGGIRAPFSARAAAFPAVWRPPRSMGRQGDAIVSQVVASETLQLEKRLDARRHHDNDGSAQGMIFFVGLWDEGCVGLLRPGQPL